MSSQIGATIMIPVMASTVMSMVIVMGMVTVVSTVIESPVT